MAWSLALAFSRVAFGASTTAETFSTEDLRRLGLNDGDAIVLRNEIGELRGQARAGPCRPGHVQAFWPESNALTQRRYDPVSGEPDYNAVVSVDTVGFQADIDAGRLISRRCGYTRSLRN